MISVIIPFFNAEKTIRNTIQSVIRQETNQWELVLVDDGSTDKSRQIATEYSMRDKRIHVFTKKHSGVVEARLAGIDLCEGECFTFVDADDICMPNMISEMEKIIEKNDIGVLQYGVLSKHGLLKKPRIQQTVKFDSKTGFRFCTDLSQIEVTLWAKVFKKDLALKCMDKLHSLPQVFIGEDSMINAILFSNAESVGVSEQCVYYYRSSGGTSKRYQNEYVDLEKLYQWRKQFLIENGMDEYMSANLRQVFNIAVYSFQQKGPDLNVKMIANQLTSVIEDIPIYGTQYKHKDLFKNLNSYSDTQLKNIYHEKIGVRLKQFILKIF